MIKELRIFPRYSTEKLNFELIENNAVLNCKVQNIALAGLRIEGEQPSLKSLITLRAANQSFELKLTKVWNMTEHCGYKIQFHDYQEFKKWVIFLRALHKIKLRQL